MSEAAFCPACVGLPEGQLEKAASNGTNQIVLSLPGIRHLLAEYMKKQVARKAPRQHYPAPYAILDLWARHYGDSRLMMDEEANSVARLIQGDRVRNLIRVFFLQTRLKGLGDKKSFVPRHVHVIGAGTMGGDIAAFCSFPRGLKQAKIRSGRKIQVAEDTPRRGGHGAGRHCQDKIPNLDVFLHRPG